MAAARAPHGNNQPPKIIIVKKIVGDHGGGHHGGAWKVAYADFVTAMMAFFLLLWILGATTEKQRKSIADYFTPTMIELRENSAGSNGMFGGSSITDKDNYPHKAAQTGTRTLTIPMGATGGNKEGSGDKGSIKRAESREAEKTAFNQLKKSVERQIASDAKLAKLGKHVRFVMTQDGMRIDLVDDADYSMFALGTTALVPDASSLVGLVADAIKGTDSPIMIRGHTDSVPYGDPRQMNNWMLSSGRAEATRRRLALGGVAERRFERIEGVADREPMIAKDAADPRNRRVAITLLYKAGRFGT
ncbi:chemotaxis protein MotB [Sphingomonas guangdongensis]|uniref:Chemotaxis protein MotB n=1 Tax=Sphingomonas guangdongensis TaxID=1141890 RepID=A0A285QFB3_9SPHN|nr:flagellar motor protein MotB [Sphingomonas guangdongensis]SOB80218.1 chemotaxis protein MotB [Sphingomonas guangdongensis]